MSAKKQTAVEWLVQQIFGDHTSQWQKEIDQADAMFEQQIIDAWDNGYANGYDLGKYDDEPNPDDAEQYYAETYGKD